MLLYSQGFRGLRGFSGKDAPNYSIYITKILDFDKNEIKYSTVALFSSLDNSFRHNIIINNKKHNYIIKIEDENIFKKIKLLTIIVDTPKKEFVEFCLEMPDDHSNELNHYELPIEIKYIEKKTLLYITIIYF